MKEIHCFVGNPIYQAVFLGDSPGPTAAEHISQWLGFAGTFERIPDNRVNEIEDSQRDRSLVFDPKAEVLKELGLKYRDPLSLPLHQAFLFSKRLLSAV